MVERNGRVSKNELNDELVKNYLNDIKDDQILLKILNELYKGSLDENQNIDTNKMLTEFQTKPEYDLSLDVINKVSKNEQLVRTFLDIVSESYVPKKDIRVLEINLTNGIMAEEVDNQLATAHIYPIDVSYTIAVKSLDKLSDEYKGKAFKLIEWKSKESSFPPDVTSTDLVIIKDSQDLWEVDTEAHLQEAYDVVCNKGYVLAVFRYQLTEPELALNAMNGKKSLNNSDLEKRILEFVKTAQNLGFNLIGRKTDSIGSMSVLFRKVLSNVDPPSKENIIEINTNCNKWFETLKEKIIEMKEKEEKDENIWLIANDSPKNGIIGLINCLRLEPGGESIRCLFDYDNYVKLPIDFKEKPFSDILNNDLPINVLRNGKLGTYRHTTLPKDYDKVESNEYFLNIGQTRDLSGLQWFDMKNLASPEVAYDMINQEVKRIPINIYCTGMNFRDVMLATGMSDPLVCLMFYINHFLLIIGRIVSGPQSLFTDCLLGFEFAGRRIDTGERVCGFEMSRCYATSVEAIEDFISPVPDHWTLEDAVTVLSTYSTVWYGVIERAHLQKGMSIITCYFEW